MHSLFICYAREDFETVAAFKVEFDIQVKSALKNSTLDSKVELKIDRTPGAIQLGDNYEEKIESLISNSSGSIIFISNSLKQSDFINNFEIPRILSKRRQDPNYIITPIFIDPPEEFDSEILYYQAPNNDETPLSALSSELKELVLKNCVSQLIYQIEDINKLTKKKIEENQLEKRTEFLDSRRSIFKIISSTLISIFFVYFLFQNIFSLTEIKEDLNILPTTSLLSENTTTNPMNEATIPNSSTSISNSTLCVTNAEELYNEGYSEFILNSPIMVTDCDEPHDGEVFSIFTSIYDENSDFEDITDLYYDLFEYCFDEFLLLTGYSPYESLYIVEILIINNGKNLDYNCLAIPTSEETGDWNTVKLSITDSTKKDFYDYFEYTVSSVDNLSVGDCFLHPFSRIGSGSFDEEIVNNLVVVSCDYPHSIEVFDKFNFKPNKEQDIKTIEDDLGKYCSDNADTLYSSFSNYDYTRFFYFTNRSKLNNKEETFVYCIASFDHKEGFLMDAKRTKTIRDEVKQRSYQLDTLNYNLEPNININNCPDEPLPGYSEGLLEFAEYYYFSIEWINLDVTNNNILKIAFYDAVDFLIYEIDLNTFKNFEIFLKNWEINVPIAWEYSSELDNNFAKVEVEFNNNGEILKAVCEIDIYEFEN